MAGGASDPYATLNMPHSASIQDIKRAYRTMARKYHPDKFVASGIHDEVSRNYASAQFTKCASAYALLSDPQKRAEYDHIYKYGGFDGNDDEVPMQRFSTTQRSSKNTGMRKSELNSTGVGYACYDPFEFLWTRGRVESRRTVAAIQVPNKSHIASTGTAGFCVLFTSGHVLNSPTTGSTKRISETTKYFPLEKRVQTTKETVTLFSDGRKEVMTVEGDGTNEARQFSTYNSTTESSNHQRINKELPWYVHTWNQILDKLSMCYNPCAAVTARD
jgi:curved DNA-binding protein CbpA